MYESRTCVSFLLDFLKQPLFGKDSRGDTGSVRDAGCGFDIGTSGNSGTDFFPGVAFENQLML